MAANTDDVYALTRSLWAVNAILQKGLRRMIDPTRWAVLHLTGTRGPIRPSEIAKALDISASSVTRHVQALEAASSIEVMGELGDRRACLIGITEKGAAELDGLERAGIEYFQGELAGWDEADVRRLAELLGQLHRSLVHGHERRQAARSSWRQRRAPRPAGPRSLAGRGAPAMTERDPGRSPIGASDS